MLILIERYIVKLEITKYMQENPDWEVMITDSPFYVKTKREGIFVLLKYDQIRSDMTIPMVRECRGIILDESAQYNPVCVPCSGKCLLVDISQRLHSISGISDSKSLKL